MSTVAILRTIKKSELPVPAELLYGELMSRFSRGRRENEDILQRLSLCMKERIAQSKRYDTELTDLEKSFSSSFHDHADFQQSLMFFKRLRPVVEDWKDLNKLDVAITDMASEFSKDTEAVEAEVNEIWQTQDVTIGEIQDKLHELQDKLYTKFKEEMLQFNDSLTAAEVKSKPVGTAVYTEALATFLSGVPASTASWVKDRGLPAGSQSGNSTECLVGHHHAWFHF